MSERGQSQAGQFEMLHAEGDANDGDTKKDTPKQVGQAYPASTNKEPDDVHQGGQTAVGRFFVDDFTSERPQSQNAEFDGL